MSFRPESAVVYGCTRSAAVLFKVDLRGQQPMGDDRRRGSGTQVPSEAGKRHESFRRCSIDHLYP